MVNHNRKLNREDQLTTITRPAALVRQGSLKLYTTSLRVADLMISNFYSINKLDPELGQGYQRLLNETRAKRLSDYLLDGQAEHDAFLPTSIFLATSKDIPFDTASNSITFDVDRVGPFNVVDGQHRIAGLKMAAEKDPDLLNFEIPVNIGVGLSDISQMCHFLIVNTTQRPVDKAVEQQIIARLSDMLEVEKMPVIPRWIRRQVEKGEDAKALIVANFLNSDPNSPWFEKIRMANEEDGASASINQKSFVNSLKKYVLSANNPISNPSFDSKRAMILSNYWRALVELLVDDESSESSVLFKTIGVDLFHIVSQTIFLHSATKGDFTKEFMKAVLRRGFNNLDGDNVGMSHPEWWHRGGAASGINSAAVRKLAMALNFAINVQDDVNKISI
jgi:DGQHR domain-containing protein